MQSNFFFTYLKKSVLIDTKNIDLSLVNILAQMLPSTGKKKNIYIYNVRHHNGHCLEIKKSSTSHDRYKHRDHVFSYDGSFHWNHIQSYSIPCLLLCLRQAITRDKPPDMKPLWSVRGCQNNTFIPPKVPDNRCCLLLHCITAAG